MFQLVLYKQSSDIAKLLIWDGGVRIVDAKDAVKIRSGYDVFVQVRVHDCRIHDFAARD